MFILMYRCLGVFYHLVICLSKSPAALHAPSKKRNPTNKRPAVYRFIVPPLLLFYRSADCRVSCAWYSRSCLPQNVLMYSSTATDSSGDRMSA